MKHYVLYIILAISSSVFAQKKLQYNLNVGDKFSVEQEAIQHITQDLNGVEQIIENNLMSVMNFEVIKVTANDYTLLMNFKRLKMLMSSPTLGELSNSDTDLIDSTDLSNMLFKGLLNVPVTIVMEKSGKIKSVSGGDKLIENMFVSAGIDQPEIISSSKGQMEKQFGSEALSNSFEQMTYFYPVDAVSVGNEWTNSYTGNMSAKNDWQLDAQSDEVVNISGISTTTMSTIDENVNMTLTGNQKTTILASPKNGLFKLITVTGENSGSTLVHAQDMTIPTQIKSTIIYKISQ